MPTNSDIFLENLVSDLKPVSPMRQWDGMVWALIAMATGTMLFVWYYGPRSDLMSAQPDPMFMISSGLFLVLALASAWAVIDMSRPWVGSRREGWVWTAMMAGVMPIAALTLTAIGWLRGETPAIDSDGIACLGFGIGIGLFTAAVLVAWLRRGAPSSPRRAGLLTGVAAGAAGTFAVSLHCPHSDLLHIGVWHGMTVVVAGFFGALALPRLVSW